MEVFKIIATVLLPIALGFSVVKMFDLRVKASEASEDDGILLRLFSNRAFCHIALISMVAINVYMPLGYLENYSLAGFSGSVFYIAAFFVSVFTSIFIVRKLNETGQVA
jgi:predicted permease